MHIYFSGIGGTAIGPLALIARQAGYDVSGSDKQDSQYIKYLRGKGVDAISIGQTAEQIAAAHATRPIDWLVYSSALPLEDPDHPELVFARDHGIRATKRDELLNKILEDKQLRLIAVAGTHGKTTTTAMLIWLFKELGAPLSYSVGAKISFGDMGHYEPGSTSFAYECDEFDRNFLAYHPYLSLITGVTWDHHEIFPTREDYQQAFRDFLGQSRHSVLWQREAAYLGLRALPGSGDADDTLKLLDGADPAIDTSLSLKGRFNREDAWLVAQGASEVLQQPVDELLAILDRFPGLQRRMELLAPNLYSDYAHTPEKIGGVMSVAKEMAAESGQQVVVVYEPLTNRRQHYMKDDYQDCFAGATKVYWIPSYLAREDPAQPILSPAELITRLDDPSIAEARERDDVLWADIERHRQAGDMVVGIAGGGGGSLDEWLRAKLTA